METKPVLSRQAISRFHPSDSWIVRVDREEYNINGKQAQVLKDASLAGMRGLVWFDGLAVSIPHIKSVERIASGRDNEKSFSNPFLANLRKKGFI